MTRPKLTILTPTYNRRELLSRLFESIKRQNAPPHWLEWLVVDDGSRDGTAEFLTQWRESHPRIVRFIATENGGKHRAVNRGIELARGEWILTVDSDDWLMDGALNTIQQLILAVDQMKQVAIVCGPSFFVQWTTQPQFTDEGLRRYRDWYSSAVRFDCWELMRRTTIAEHPFPEVPGENFMAESWQRAQLDKAGYLTFFVNKQITCCEYQAGGLSERSIELRSASPVSATMVYDALALPGMGVVSLFTIHANFWRFFFHALLQGKIAENWWPKIGFSMVLGFLIFVRDLVVLNFGNDCRRAINSLRSRQRTIKESDR